MINDRMEGWNIPVECHLLFRAFEILKEHVAQLLALLLEFFVVEGISRGYQVVNDPDLVDKWVRNLQCGSELFMILETAAAYVARVGGTISCDLVAADTNRPDNFIMELAHHFVAYYPFVGVFPCHG